MADALRAFRDQWQFLRAMTYAFVEAVPDARWQTRPHPRFAPFAKQVRHLVCVQGVYLEGLTKRKVDFSRKHSHYAGSLERAELVAALRAKDAELERALVALEPEAATFSLDFFGRPMDLPRYLGVIAQHESIHHGEWSFYAALGGFETPPLWRLNWGL